jgi:hypothetical protein
MSNDRARSGTIEETVRTRIEASGGRFWRNDDFGDLPAPGVSQALSRLCRIGVIQRLRRGLYYEACLTIPGPNQPNMALVRTLAARGKRVFPAGMAAAHLLGITTRIPTLIEIATSAACLPRLFAYSRVIVHKRPPRWRTLTETDAALLDVVRNRGLYSALSPDETVQKLIEYFREPGCYERLLEVAETEPTSVRAMLGAIGEQIGQPDAVLYELGDTLNPFSRYDFGILSALPYAQHWMVK